MKNNELQVQQFTWNVIDSNSYLILENNNALLIDAIDSGELYGQIENVETLTVILTHSHFDHIGGLNKIREIQPKTKVFSTSLCSNNIGNKYKNMSSTGNAFMAFYLKKENIAEDTIYDTKNDIKEFVCAPSDNTFDKEMTFCWEGHTINLLQAFGHSNDSLLALIDEKYLFSGDTILDIPTVTRFPGGSTNLFWEEDVPLLSSLSERVEIVFAGHGTPGNLNDMIAKNQRPKKYIIK